ncbi:hypothetical protein K437DRAFT_155014 [Tilletiaria anomala UBC 951]|uniref:Secreted protein n=1 Tax=Tilletiaria anomala (strain ATCC 24038 / CBS 436.72 / UBC 951) TaxID=1037660 RepID=A0A066VMX4_TILAU|nr:uncharacterized protein K437DRAFT_155014 [Tilletiaria anomala UBC 951]KDN43107.1 hypothetical protein K437DRAFT_155014 [Tilletiaria anomala UBC 951]
MRKACGAERCLGFLPLTLIHTTVASHPSSPLTRPNSPRTSVQRIRRRLRQRRSWASRQRVSMYAVHRCIPSTQNSQITPGPQPIAHNIRQIDRRRCVDAHPVIILGNCARPLARWCVCSRLLSLLIIHSVFAARETRCPDFISCVQRSRLLTVARPTQPSPARAGPVCLNAACRSLRATKPTKDTCTHV